MPNSCMLAHRRVACAAKPPGLGSGSAHVDATEEMDEDRDEREDASEIIDSGEDCNELDLAREDLRADVGNGCGKTHRQDGFGLSKVIRAVLAIRACSIAIVIEDRRGPRPSAPAAGVPKVGVKHLDCGTVSFGVGKGAGRGRAGRTVFPVQVARGVGSKVPGALLVLVGVDSFEFDQTGSSRCLASERWISAMVALDLGANSAWPKSTVSNAGVKCGMTALHELNERGEDLGEASDDADGEYFNTMSVQRWKTGSGI